VELSELYGELAAALPNNDVAEPVVLNARSVARPPDSLETVDLVVRRTVHQYMSSTVVDKAYLFAQPVHYRELGLLCLGVLLHDVDSVDLHLRSPQTEIETVRVEYAWPTESQTPSRYLVRPHALVYDVDPAVSRCGDFRGAERPFVQLTTATEDWWVGDPRPKTLLIGFGLDAMGEALAAMAQFFLNMGAPQENTQFDLDQPPWEGGVTDGSAELRVVLPGDPHFADGFDASSLSPTVTIATDRF